MATSRQQNPLWNEIPAGTGKVYEWDAASLYIREPPYFDAAMAARRRAAMSRGARALAIFGDSITTDHISPAGAIKPYVAGRRLSAATAVSRSTTSTVTARAAATTR